MFKQILKSMPLAILASSFLITGQAVSQEKPNVDIKIGVRSLFFEKYNKMMEGTNCVDFDKFDSPYAHRVTVELTLICKALHLGDIKPNIELISFEYTDRANKEIAAGKLDMAAQSRWFSSIDPEKFHASQAIVRNGEFKKGIFGLASNKALFEVDSLEKLRKFEALSSKRWTVDWKTIKDLKLPVTDSTGQIPKMYQMVNKKRADYVLAEFRSTDSFHNEFDGITLTAVPNITLVLNASRHFIVSKKSPNEKVIFETLEKGIDILRSKGAIEKAYYQSGFYNEKVKDWKVINNT